MSQSLKAAIQAFLFAVNSWKMFVHWLKQANKANDNINKKVFGKQVFHWRKEAEKFKAQIDMLRGA